jgi:dihydrolipoamide dehydrogenase
MTVVLAHTQVEYVKGWGQITGPNSVEVAAADGKKTTLNAKNIIIATGSEVTPMNGLPIDETKWVK